MPPKPPFQRAAEAPALPTGTIGFIWHCQRHYRALMLLMLVMETGQAA